MRPCHAFVRPELEPDPWPKNTLFPPFQDDPRATEACLVPSTYRVACPLSTHVNTYWCHWFDATRPGAVVAVRMEPSHRYAFTLPSGRTPI